MNPSHLAKRQGSARFILYPLLFQSANYANVVFFKCLNGL